MLPRHINKENGQDNYRALALYIADAKIGKTKGEKTLHSWYTGGHAENYLEGMIEVEATQALNTRSKAVKTYHLMDSFRPKDEDKLTPEVLKDIERILAESLGFSEHQRHSGVHHNTDNMHLHIAYNMIHPKKFNRHAPYMDYPKLSRACRAIEQKYGLVIDQGMEPGSLRKDGRASAKIKSLEAQTGQESLFSYVMRHKPQLMNNLESAENWQDIHREFLKFGLLLKPSGAGLTIKDRYGKHYVKPSSIDRYLSKSKLTNSFGDYEEPAKELFRSIEAQETYSAIPLYLGPERNNLYAIFQEEMIRRKAVLEDIRQESARRYGEIKEHWQEKRETFETLPLTRLDREKIRLEIKERETDELASMRLEIVEKRNLIRAEIPYTTWTKCLQHKAALGDETALAILRSKKEVVLPEKAAPFISQVDHPEMATKWLKEQKKVLETAGLSNQNRRSLLAVTKMREILDNAAHDFTFAIDTKGTVIFKMAGGGTIRDTGREIHFTANDKKIKEIAVKYATKRWGLSITEKDNGITRNELASKKQLTGKTNDSRNL